MPWIRAILLVITIALAFYLFSLKANSGWKPRSNKTLKYLGSLHLAVLLLAGLAALLGIATFLESAKGTEYVVGFIYRARWFEFILIGIWINIFSATILRLPVNKQKIGFYFTHLGILTLLIGSLVTRLSGIEGTLTLEEGRSDSELVLPGNSFQIFDMNERILNQDMTPGSVGSRFQAKDSPQIEIRDYQEHSTLAHEYTKDSKNDDKVINPGVHLKIKSSMFNLDQWLLAVNEDLRNPAVFQMGPATIELIQLSDSDIQKAITKANQKLPASKKTLKISLDDGKTYSNLEVEEQIGKTYKIPGGTIKLTAIFENAAVTEAGTIIEHTQPGSNPAITFEMEHNGNQYSGVRFQSHPDFQGAHQADGKKILIYMEGFGSGIRHKGDLKILVSREHPDQIFYTVKSSRSSSGGPLKLNKMIPLGWSDALLVVDQFIPDTMVQRVVKPTQMKSNQKSSLPFIKVSIPKLKLEREILYGETFHIPGTSYNLFFGQNTVPLPFEVQLIDFRKVDYPNTSRAMSYESDVKVIDLASRTQSPKKIETTISMNNVLDHAGWRFFQSSFRIDGTREFSTFQLARDPGIEIIYVGSMIMVFGIALMFWWKPVHNKRGA